MKVASLVSTSAALALVIALAPHEHLLVNPRHSQPDLDTSPRLARLRRQASTTDPTLSSPLGSDGKPFGTDGSGSGIPNDGTSGSSNAQGGAAEGGGAPAPGGPAAAPVSGGGEGGGGGGGGSGGGGGKGEGGKESGGKGSGKGGGSGKAGGGGSADSSAAAPPAAEATGGAASAPQGPPEINATSIQGGNLGAGYGGATSPTTPSSVASAGSDLSSQCLAAGFIMPPGGLASNGTAAAASPATANISGSAISAAVMNTTNGFVATAATQVVVAPKMGDLRMVPFAINVDAGSTANFFWGAGPHTVTQSSALEVCNKTKTPTAFVSGLQNATSSFTVPVNDSSTIWYYCSVPTHCQKGMFGMINPALSTDKNDQMGTMISKMASKNSKVKVVVDQTTKITVGNTFANTWGDKFAASQMPTDPDLMEMAVMNILATKQYFAQNAAANGTAAASGSASQGPVPTASGSGAVASGAAAVATDAASGASPAAASAAVPTAPASSAGPKLVEEHQAWAVTVLLAVIVAMM